MLRISTHQLIRTAVTEASTSSLVPRRCASSHAEFRERSSAVRAQIPPPLPRRVYKAREAGDEPARPQRPVRRGESLPAPPKNFGKGGPTSSSNSFNRPHPLSDPYFLTQRVLDLSAQQKLDEAVELVRRARKEAANVVVYNTLIGETLKAQRNKLAWQLWMEMKRAGVKPTPRSFTIFFSSIVPESVTKSFMSHITTVYSQWTATRDNGKLDTMSRNADEASIVPTNAYLTLLSKLPASAGGGIESMLAAYEALPQKGPLAPDAQTYTILLKAAVLAEEPERREESVARLLPNAERFNFSPRDVSALCSALRSYDRVNKKDAVREQALVVLAKVTGLSPPAGLQASNIDQARPMSRTLDAQAFFVCMLLAMQYRRTKLAATWFKQVKESQKQGRRPKEMLDTRHYELYMAASPGDAEAALVEQIRSPSKATRPEISTFTATAQASMVTGSFLGILRILQHMAGKDVPILLPTERKLLETEDAESDGGASSRRMLEGSHTKRHTPDERMVCILLQAGLASRDWRKIDRSLRIASLLGYFDVEKPRMKRTARPEGGEERPVLLFTGVKVDEQTTRRYKQHWAGRMEDALSESVEKLLQREAAPTVGTERYRQLERWHASGSSS